MSNTIFSQEEYNIFDKIHGNYTKEDLRKKLPRGWVQMYFGNKKVVDGPNLIVAQGREFVAQKLFEITDTDDTSRETYYNHKISHFAIGSGGAIVETNDVTLTGPEINDRYLAQPISLGDELYLEEPSHYEDSTEEPIVHSYRNAVKPINTHGNISLQPVEYENSPDCYTKVLCRCVIPDGEPSGLAPGASTPISEAGLYFVNNSLADTDPKKVNLFARICFAPKWKELESDIVIKWYILC